MGKSRLEAFSDGVFAIILTIMVLEIKVPHGGDLESLRPLLPVFCGYVLSFVYVGIYWNNHHHMLHATREINGRVLWANLHLLFWLSLVPVLTAWMGEHFSQSWPTALYGVALFMAGIAFMILQNSIVAYEGEGSLLGHAVGRDLKGNLSALLYATAIGLAFIRPWISDAIYGAVALMWFIPDPRIERKVHDGEGAPQPTSAR